LVPAFYRWHNASLTSFTGIPVPAGRFSILN
jgi:hypothetical protein